MSLIVVTRPSPFAEQLVAQLQENNLEAISLPLIEFSGIALSKQAETQLETVLQDDASLKHIFVSPNSVHFAKFYLQKYFPALEKNWHQSYPRNEFYAIGRRTAEELHRLGYHRIQTAPPPYHSEALLSLHSLRSPAWTKKAPSQSQPTQHCLLWCGLEGRKLLEETLSQRGFSVQRLPVYQQKNIQLSKQDKQKIQHYRQKHSQPLIITATSQSIIQQLKNTQELRCFDDYLICFSERLAKDAQQQGWRNIHMTRQADNQSLKAKLIEVALTSQGG